jgi:hypothetical protein
MKRFLVLLGLLALAGGAVYAQTATHTVTLSIPSIAVIRLDDATNMTLVVNPPAVGSEGLSVTGDTDSRRLWYTLIRSAATAKITVQLSAGTLANVPAGLDLTVVTVAPEQGNAAPVATLDDLAAHNLVTSMTSGATGQGVGDGALVTYTLVIADETLLAVNPGGTMNVTYTISGS